MPKTKAHSFESGPPPDEAPMPETEFPVRKEKYMLINGAAEVTPENSKEHDIGTCPYCGEESRLRAGERRLAPDGEVDFSCRNKHQWKFFADKVNGEFSMTKGYIRGFNGGPNGITEKVND